MTDDSWHVAKTQDDNVIAKLQAENARLREALKQICDLKLIQFMGPHAMALECKLISAVALKGEK
jgi:hypothetical protein